MNKAAQALGRLAKGVPKTYSAAEIERRSKILAGINARKRAKAKKRRMPNDEDHAPHGSALEEVWERRIEYLRKYEWERETLARMNEVKRCLRELRAHKRKMPNK